MRIRSEGESPDMESMTMPKELKDIINSEDLIHDPEGEEVKSVVQETVKLLEEAKTFEEFSNTVNLIEQAIDQDLDRKPMLDEWSTKEVVAPVWKGLLLELAKKYDFSKEDEEKK